MIDTINIKIKIFILAVIINSKTFDDDIFMLISNLITLEDKENFAFMLDNFNFKAFVLIVNEDDKVFIFKTISESDEIVNIAMN